VFTAPLPSTGCPLLLRIVVSVTQQRAAYQESVFGGTCLSSRCLAIGRYVAISCVNGPTSLDAERCNPITRLITDQKIIIFHTFFVTFYVNVPINVQNKSFYQKLIFNLKSSKPNDLRISRITEVALD
jgi:hypothetical protein